MGSPIPERNICTATNLIVSAFEPYARDGGHADLTADTPKQIYRCDFPGCDRHFVRADLCARHRERHTAKGSHLQRKDAFLNSQRSLPNGSGATSPIQLSGSVTLNASPVRSNRPIHTAPCADPSAITAPHNQPIHSAANQYHIHGVTNPNVMQAGVRMPYDHHLSASESYASYASNNVNGSQLPSRSALSSPPLMRQRSHENGFGRPASQSHDYQFHQSITMNPMQPPSTSSPPVATNIFAQQPYPSPSTASQQFRSPSSYSTLPSLPPFGFPPGYGFSANARSSSGISPPTVSSNDQQPMPNSGSNSVSDYNAVDQLAGGYSMPVFGTDGFYRASPFLIDDTLFNSLLATNNFDLTNESPPGPDPMHNPQVFSTPLPKLEPDGTAYEQPSLGEHGHTLNDLDINIRESQISEKKKDRLAEMIRHWDDIEQCPGRRSKAEILVGDPNTSSHVLSLEMFKTYLTSYWMHIHQQMPILHRPTFNPETCPDLLLLAMMCLGATCLERSQPFELTQNSAELAFFIAYHIRWDVFRDAEFRPTAKLWTFQTMLLLELFEKMFSTLVLHERAHVHHATTLTVMRRGSSLIGRSATDTSQGGNDPTRTPPGPDGSINTSGQNTPDAFWNRWITAEATRRVAFAAFIIDSTHATLFGHSAVMSPHDLKLTLPCDEALWSATSSGEVQRTEASLAANGFKPMSFLDGLKRTLTGQKVRTNTFGRVILMAGLFNVSWHMNQRDLQVSSLGVQSTLGTQIRWRSPLTRAFDFWRKDFDESLSTNEHWLQVCSSMSNDRSSVDYREKVFESRTCLHSLAHMSMHVDMIDCQVFAGAETVLGRPVTDADRAAVTKRMREQWAPSARARDATFYALQFLRVVLIPEEPMNSNERSHPHHPPTFTYSARDDYLLNRPWVLFFAMLIVWSYGYALDGPIRPSNYTLTTRELQIFDMKRYLARIGGVTSPDDLEKLKDRNSCLGLLLLLRSCFKQPRWELLHQANEILGSCVDLLLPGYSEIACKQGV